MTSPKKNSNRKPRADAERNRERLLEAAKQVFAERGSSASLEEIARAADVGIGTLYRHFPTRETLVDEIYRKRGDQLAVAAVQLAQESPPIEAVRRWLLLFIDYLANKEIMAEILNSLTRSRDPLCPSSGHKTVAALAGLLEQAERHGATVRKADSLDLLCAITGVASFQSQGDWEASAKRLVDIMVAGICHDYGPP